MRKAKRDQQLRRQAQWWDVLRLVALLKNDEGYAFALFCGLRDFSKRWHRKGKATDCAAKMFAGLTGRRLMTIDSALARQLRPINGRTFTYDWAEQNEPHGRRYYYASDVFLGSTSGGTFKAPVLDSVLDLLSVSENR